MDADGGVKDLLGGARAHRNGKTLGDLAGILAAQVQADHPLSGTERFHDLIIYADTVPEEKLPQAVHYERTAPHAD